MLECLVFICTRVHTRAHTHTHTHTHTRTDSYCHLLLWQTLAVLSLTPSCFSLPATRRREVSKAPAATQPVSIHMARVNAPFDAALAALDAAGIRKQKIDGLILIQKQELGRLADILKNKGRGRPNKDHTEQVKAASARIMRLERNVLPDESEPKPPPTIDELRASASQHPQHHASAGAVPGGRPAGASRPAPLDVGNDDEDGDAGDWNEHETEDPEFQHFYKVSVAQKAFNSKISKAYMQSSNQSRESKKVVRSQIRYEPENMLASGCPKELMGVGPVHICAPHLHLGLPKTPCPKHGWVSVDTGKVSTNGMCPGRRVYARTNDEWVVGTLNMCGLCKEERNTLKEKLAALQNDPFAQPDDVVQARAAVKRATYSYRSYNPDSLFLYAQRYYWYVASLPYVILNRRTAVTRELAREVMIPGSNPTDLAKRLLEFKSEWFDLLRAQVLGMHLWAKQRRIGQQLTMDQFRMSKFEAPTHESVAMCAPGHALLRHLFLAVSDADEQYKFSWRQQNVAGTVWAVDASMKRGKALPQCKIRQTLWSCDVQAPLGAFFVNSASMDDDGFSAGCTEVSEVMEKLAIPPAKLAYMDCTVRDGPGFARRFPHFSQVS